MAVGLCFILWEYEEIFAQSVWDHFNFLPITLNHSAADIANKNALKEKKFVTRQNLRKWYDRNNEWQIE